MDPAVVRRAAQVGASLTRASCPQLADEIDALLADRPLAMEAPAPGLTALTNRLVSYLETASEGDAPRGGCVKRALGGAA